MSRRTSTLNLQLSTPLPTCPKCAAPMNGPTCDLCESFAKLRERIRLRQRRYTPRGARWARQQIAAHEQRPESQSQLPPSDRE